jgi:hypothetical protein
VSDVARGGAGLGEVTLGGKGFLSRGEPERGGPEEGLPTLLLGVMLRSPSLGVKGREPVLGVRLRPPGRGVKLLPPGRGVKLRPPGRGVMLREPVLGVRVLEPVLGVKLLELERGVKLREPVRGAADLGPLLKPSRGFEMRGRAVDDGRSFPAGPSVLFTNFESVEEAGSALCTRGLSPIGFGFSGVRRVVGRAGRDVEAPGRAAGFRVVRLSGRRGGGIVVRVD